MTMLSIVLGISIASLASGQPMSLNEPLSCSFFTCSDAILGIKLQFQLISYSSFLCSLGAVEACESVIGSSEEMIDCVKNILESNGQGDCKACICHIIPMFCHDKETVSTETKSQKNLAQRTELVKHAKSNQCGPDETTCPAGCCPEANWYCCIDGPYCAATAADCPFEAKKTLLVKLAKSNQCGPDQTPCPSVGSSGCCPEANWFCCVDGHYCAATAADCPNVAERVSLVEMAKNKQCGPDDTTCPNGCCPVAPELNWFCCEDYCAATAADCPFEVKKTLLVKLTKSN